jgi:hypothetical protein
VKKRKQVMPKKRKQWLTLSPLTQYLQAYISYYEYNASCALDCAILYYSRTVTGYVQKEMRLDLSVLSILGPELYKMFKK